MDILDKAIVYATEAHSGAIRKDGCTPYIVHPLEAAAVAASLTSDKEVIAAAVLHDVVEDTPKTIEDVSRLFGKRVAALVASDTEDKRPGLPSEDTWTVRKLETLELLKSMPRDDQIIVLADKLSNMRAMYRDHIKIGDKIWDRFNQKDKSKQAWYYLSIAELLSELKDTVAWREYKELCDKVFG